jgi:uncharacterized membrane protein YhaH (DUF805 family)
MIVAWQVLHNLRRILLGGTEVEQFGAHLMLTDLRTYKSFEGRIGRQTWWLSQLIASLVFMIPYLIAIAVVSMTFDYSGPEPRPSTLGIVVGGGILLLTFIAAMWVSLAVNTKRWHDHGKSGWNILWSLVPFVNIWAFIKTGFLRGTEGPNQYGPDPIAD